MYKVTVFILGTHQQVNVNIIMASIEINDEYHHQPNGQERQIGQQRYLSEITKDENRMTALTSVMSADQWLQKVLQMRVIGVHESDMYVRLNAFLDRLRELIETSISKKFYDG